MPILDRTALNSSDNLHLLAKAAVCQAYGDITHLSDEFQVSRKTIRKVKKEGLSLLSAALTHYRQCNKSDCRYTPAQTGYYFTFYEWC
jgi:transcriptional antiterminator